MKSDDRFQGSSFRFEPPDLCLWALVGDISVETIRAIMDEQERVVMGMPCIFVIADVSRIGAVSSEARRAATEVRPVMNMRGVAYIGASFSMRVVATLVAKANTLLNGITNNPTRFFETEAQARAWIEQRRAEVAAGAH